MVDESQQSIQETPQSYLTIEEKGKLKIALNDLIPEMVAKNKTQRDALLTDDDGATITFNIDQSNLHTVTLAGNRILVINGGKVGQVFALRLVQDAGGNRSVTWFSTISWAGASAPTLTTTGGRADTFIFIITAINPSTGAVNYDGYVVGQNIG